MRPMVLYTVCAHRKSREDLGLQIPDKISIILIPRNLRGIVGSLKKNQLYKERSLQ